VGFDCVDDESKPEVDVKFTIPSAWVKIRERKRERKREGEKEREKERDTEKREK